MRIKENKKGVTLVELLVAMTAASFVILTAFWFWRTFNTHVINQNRKMVNQAAIMTISRDIAFSLRKSDVVLRVEPNRVMYIKRDASDTLELAYVNGALLRNGEEIRSATITQFITNLTFSLIEENREQNAALIAIDLSTNDNRGMLNDLRSFVCVRVLEE